MKQKIFYLANKYCKNKLLRFSVMPIWRLFHRLEHQKQISNFHNNGLTLLKKFSDICFQNDIVFWLDFGTLLGSFRENDFIKHDYDIDLGVMFNDRDKLNNLLLKSGFKIVREFEILEDGKLLGLERTYTYASVLVDLFYYHKISEKELLLNSFTPIINEKEYLGKAEIKDIIMPYCGFKKHTFKGIDVYVPSDTKNFLEHYYGKDFMIPNPNYDYKKTMRNIKYYSRKEKLANYREYLKLYL